MKRNQIPLVIALAFFMLVAAVVSLPAQEFRGSILGIVTDPSGAVVTEAKIKVTNESTNTSTEVQTNAEGNYVVPFLLPAKYTVSVDAAGFKTATRKDVIVQVQDRITLNFALEIGSPTEVVNITAESPILSIANSDLGQVIDRHYLDRLPISGRSPCYAAD